MGNRHSRAGMGPGSQLGPPATPAFRFLDLPPEVRLLVYPHLLVTQDRLHWQGACFPPHGPRRITTRTGRSSSISTVTALLFTCHTIHTEAIKEFYRANTFVLPTVTGAIQPILRHQPLLLFCKHLEIHYTWYPSMRDTLVINNADDALSACLREVMDLCPFPQSFSMSGIPDVDEVTERATQLHIVALRSLNSLR